MRVEQNVNEEDFGKMVNQLMNDCYLKLKSTCDSNGYLDEASL